MRTNPRSNMMAAVAASLARHGSAAAVDLSWHAPNATNINNLAQVMAGSDIYGWVYNNSQVPADEYGVYNWCNMPHVRKTEYKVPASEYKLQYVEVVGCAIQSRAGSLPERADP
jgi:acid phosphatase